MLPSTVNWAVVAATLIRGVLGHNIQLGAHSRECFHEMLHKDDKMTVTFQVGDREFGGAGNLDIDFWVCGLCNGACAWDLWARFNWIAI